VCGFASFFFPTLTKSLSILSFSGPACKTFTPLLSVLYEDAKEEGIVDFEVVYVSSDVSADSMDAYMQEKHADWLRVPYHTRQSYKEKYGVFAGKEQPDFPNTSRRSGIPTLVIVGPDGKEEVLLDCDTPSVLKEMEQKGAAFLEQWAKFKW
jgi:hypothetical protein